MKQKLYDLALWTQMPGNDFDRKWAVWLLEHDKLWDAWEWVIGGTLGRLFCLIYGHVVTDDHCGKPEHRFCFACAAPTPNQDIYKGGHYSVSGI